MKRATLAIDEGRLTLRLNDVAKALGVSRRTVEMWRAAGKFPAPCMQSGKVPFWSPEVITSWVKGDGVSKG